MSNRIDQLFKDVLSDHKITPSAEAWEKVQAGMTKKNKIIIVWRIAAAFVLFGTLISAWFLLNQDESIRPVKLTENTELVVPKKNSSEKPIEQIIESTKPNVAQITKQEKRKKGNEKGDVKEEQNSLSETIPTENNEQQMLVEEIVVVTEATQVAQVAKTEKAVVIEFTLESISNEPVIAVVQSTEVENSGLKKILEAARDVKNGESDLGIIRDAKDQLFALDFKKDKPKRN
jgi:hypothetical protein